MYHLKQARPFYPTLSIQFPLLSLALRLISCHVYSSKLYISRIIELTLLKTRKEMKKCLIKRNFN